MERASLMILETEMLRGMVRGGRTGVRRMTGIKSGPVMRYEGSREDPSYSSSVDMRKPRMKLMPF